eukprot:15938580-Heterocapsa_arctica.AAC.1
MNALVKHSLCCVNTFHPEGAGPTWTDALRTSRIDYIILHGLSFFEYKDFSLLIVQQGSFNFHRFHNGLIMHHFSPTSGIAIGTTLITQYA